MSRVFPQLLCFSYHKTGTSLFLHVMTKVSRRLGRSLVNHYGLVERLEPEPDIVLLPHSLLRRPPDRPYRAIRLIRDPRDIWVSGYLYHRRCDEEWCRNADLDPSPPIGWPQVDYSVVHRPEDWKRQYLARLGGKSYQRNLLDRAPAEGLDFELGGYTGCTLAAMRDWGGNCIDALDVKLEDVMADFDGSLARIFGHFGLSAAESEAALEVARSEDVRRMDDAAIASRPQISSRTISKWREVLSADQLARFEAQYGDLICGLGYEPSLAPTSGSSGLRVNTRRLGVTGATEAEAGPQPPAQSRSLDVWLLADGNVIRPTVADRGSYTFVVPADRQRVRLQSGRFAWAVVQPPNPSNSNELGVPVTRIDLRSESDDEMIAADDPRLTEGWHDLGGVAPAIWRWTNGSADLPWRGASVPVVVTVRCAAPNGSPGDGGTSLKRLPGAKVPAYAVVDGGASPPADI